MSWWPVWWGKRPDPRTSPWFQGNLRLHHGILSHSRHEKSAPGWRSSYPPVRSESALANADSLGFFVSSTVLGFSEKIIGYIWGVSRAPPVLWAHGLPPHSPPPYLSRGPYFIEPRPLSLFAHPTPPWALHVFGSSLTTDEVLITQEWPQRAQNPIVCHIKGETELERLVNSDAEDMAGNSSFCRSVKEKGQWRERSGRQEGAGDPAGGEAACSCMDRQTQGRIAGRQSQCLDNNQE